LEAERRDKKREHTATVTDRYRYVILYIDKSISKFMGTKFYSFGNFRSKNDFLSHSFSFFDFFLLFLAIKNVSYLSLSYQTFVALVGEAYYSLVSLIKTSKDTATVVDACWDLSYSLKRKRQRERRERIK
jgi:hypothetical protein